MQTPKEALLALYRGAKADFIPAENLIQKDLAFPGERYFGSDQKGYDAWGVNWTQLGPDPGLDGSTVSANFKLFDDMEDWKEHVNFPNLNQLPVKEVLQGQASQFNSDEAVISGLLLSGQFERLNEMIGMEDALCAFYEYPDEMHEYMDAMCEYKLKCIELTYDAIQPDMIQMHDDWGTAQNMFMSPDLWREFIKPNEIRYAKKIHELGMIYEHHSCGYIMQIVPDLIEIGIDVISPLNVCNDLDTLLESYGDKITFKGGINNQLLDEGECDAIQIREEVISKMDQYARKGRYVPGFIYSRHDVLDIFNEEVNKYGADIFKK
ncbi:MAG: uroporphyrinogen decarboxylase family protein [Hespellia sp.]|nr:uroporphyrinogen decarboxylase family protein [Hespellia sp.]